MKFYVGVTDNQWFDVVSHIPGIDEVNFWQPGGGPSFKVLAPGEPFLFKLHSPLNFIVGGGFFAHSTKLPISLAWEAFDQKNGALSYDEMRSLIQKHRTIKDNRLEDFTIGCIILEQPFFFEQSAWLPVPPDWKPSIQQGKHYDMDKEPAKSFWEKVNLRIANKYVPFESRTIMEEGPRFGAPTLITPRLGQGSFRVLVTDAYQRSCAITEEHTLPALEAAHIKPVEEKGPNAVYNGLLLRSDVHRLFDRGYITVTPELRIEVSRRIREEFENGRYYYPFHGNKIHHLPKNPQDWPSKELLIWHNESMFKG